MDSGDRPFAHSCFTGSVSSCAPRAPSPPYSCRGASAACGDQAATLGKPWPWHVPSPRLALCRGRSHLVSTLALGARWHPRTHRRVCRFGPGQQTLGHVGCQGSKKKWENRRWIGLSPGGITSQQKLEEDLEMTRAALSGRCGEKEFKGAPPALVGSRGRSACGRRVPLRSEGHRGRQGP